MELSTSLSTLQPPNASFDALILESPDLDAFCSSSYWTLPAHHTIMHPATPFILRDEHGIVALSQSTSPQIGPHIHPLEAAWGLSSPLASPTPTKLALSFTHWANHDLSTPWNVALLSGLTRDSETFDTLVHNLDSFSFRLGLGQPTRRYIASLDGGVDGFLSRRSPKFRANLRRIWRRAHERDIRFDIIQHPLSLDACDALYQRIQSIEDRSWKGLSGNGINDGPMRDFYARMIRRLGPHGRLRALFVQHEGQDLAYIFGGVLNNLYRGLQVSFDNQHRSLSLGNLAQYAMIRHLCSENISTYDLGSEIDYKERWGERVFETCSLYIMRKL